MCRPLLNQKHDMEWFLLQRFVELVRIYFLLIVSRNHSNRVNIALISGFRQIYAACCPRYDMQINRWRNFKDKGHLFTLNLPMTTTKIRRISLLRTFFLFLGINLILLHRRCCLMLKLPKILILLCGKIFSVFYPNFHETFPNSCGFAI